MTERAANGGRTRAILFANTDWYLYNFRLALATALRDGGAEVLLVSPRGRYGDRFARLGFRWKELPFDRRTLNPTAQVAAIARLARLYSSERPDIVHHFTIKCAVYGSIAAKLAGVPVIVNALAGLGSTHPACGGRSHRLARMLALSSLTMALPGTRVILQNPEDRDFLVARGVARRAQCALIRGSGVDLSRFRPPAARPPSPVSVLLASRLLWRKGLAEFAGAARLVRRRHPCIRFAVAGGLDDGNPDALTPADIRSLRETGGIDILGHVEDMNSLLARTSIVALPTTYGEGVPRILIEGAASGLPLVASDVPGCREIVRDGVNGFLVPPGDTVALAGAIERLASDDRLRERLGAASRRLAVAEFGEDAIIEATLALYRMPATTVAPDVKAVAAER